jgi:hypothetical protein
MTSGGGPRAFGSPADDPREIMAVAVEELAAAATPLRRRQAAEKANLALVSAIERATGAEIGSTRGLRAALAQIHRCGGAQHVGRSFQELRTALHSECFYQARGVPGLEMHFGRATELIETILDAGRALRRAGCVPE